MIRFSRIVLPVVLVLALAAGASAVQFNVTVLPLSTLGSLGVAPRVVRGPVGGPMATEVGLRLNDRWELVVGADYASRRAEFPDEPVQRDNQTFWNVGARYFFGGDDQLKPFAFGNYGVLVAIGDGADRIPESSMLKLGAGAVAPINDRWGVVAQTGIAWAFVDDRDVDTTETSTFSSVGLRYNF